MKSQPSLFEGAQEIPELTKRCSRCSQYKPLSEFKNDCSRKGGKYPQCRGCEREYREQNSEKIRAHKKAYREANAEAIKAHKHQYQVENADRIRERKHEKYLENCDAIREKARAYYLRNPEKAKLARQAYYEAHREEALAYLREYRKQNKPHLAYLDRRYRATHKEEKREYERQYYAKNRHVEKAKKHRRRAREKAGGRFSSREFRELCERNNHLCLCCGERKPMTLDHIVPLSKGGKNTIDNIQPLCLGCNIKKATQIIDYRRTP